MTGRIHSVQSLGAVDGPGLRAVVFMQGCPLRCVYCHNPDTWDPAGGIETKPEALAEKILRLKNYYLRGGVTVSGGEPLLQGAFVGKLFEILRSEGLHTALDTSGIGTDENIEAVLPHTSLVLCDLKFPSEEMYIQNTRASLSPVLDFLKKTESRSIPLWIRQVIVPGLTDSFQSVLETARIARSFSNLEKIELLPFRKICEIKYAAMGIPFPLADTPACSEETVRKLTEILDKA